MKYKTGRHITTGFSQNNKSNWSSFVVKKNIYMENVPLQPSYTYSESCFWVINSSGNKILRDPKLENITRGFDWGKYSSGTHGFDDLNYMWWEMNDSFDHGAIGCDYERYGCVINPGDVVVDIGGNIGMFSRRALSRGAQKVISFEPSSHMFSLLVDNTPRDRVECHRLAISEEESVASFFREKGCGLGGGALHRSSRELNFEERVLTTTMDKLFDVGLLPQKIDFLKIDCEGSEWKVFSGLSNENLKKISKIAMEFHIPPLTSEIRELLMSRLIDDGFNHFTMYSGSDITINFWRD